jgi:hypothetical protein
VRLPRFFSRRRADIDQLAARCAVCDRSVAMRVAAVARAGERHVAEPDSADAFAALEAAEELLFIAEHEQREARAELRRAQKDRRFARSAEDPSRATESTP